MSAAKRWSDALRAWAIPQEILDRAPESPWGFNPEMFARRADAGRAADTPSRRVAMEALPEAGSVMDVGCGAGAASLPLAQRAGEIIGVDPSQGMLDEFSRRVREAGVKHHLTLLGTWDEVSESAPLTDLVLCHHVAYNVPELGDLVAGMSAHARRRVVLELTAVHPLSWLKDLWRRFHGLERPSGPTADDAVAVLREAGLDPRREDWDSGQHSSWSAFPSAAELVAWVRRRLCLPADRDGEIREALGDRIVEGEDGGVSMPPRRIVSLWWDV